MKTCHEQVTCVVKSVKNLKNALFPPDTFRVLFLLHLSTLRALNVWCIKFRSKHSTVLLLCLLRNLMHQTLAQDKELRRSLKVSIPINFTIPSLNETMKLWLELVLKTSPFVTNDPMSTDNHYKPLPPKRSFRFHNL